MARVVPSDIVNIIEQAFPGYVETYVEKPLAGASAQKTFTIEPSNFSVVEALVQLIKRLDESFLPHSKATIATFFYALALLESKVEEHRREELKPDTEGGVLSTVGNVWRRMQPLQPLPAFDNLDCLAAIVRIMINCADHPSAPSTTMLRFVDPEQYRQELLADLFEVQRSLADASWKGATVLAGSLIEALLCHRIEKTDEGERNVAVAAALATKTIIRQPDSDFTRWGLLEFVAVGAQLKLISPGTAKLCDVARNFRNLIHAGKALREHVKCTRGTAHAAVGALYSVIEDAGG